MHASRLDRADARVLGLLVFVLALAIRVVYLFDIRDNPFFRVPVIDAELYHQMAQAFTGPGVGHVPFQMPPGWPLLLSLLYRLTGPSLVAAHGLQILLGAATAALVFAIGRRFSGTLVGLVGAGFVATSKSLLFLEGDLLAAPLATLLGVTTLFFLVRWAQNGERTRDLAAAGVALGLGAITVPLVLVTVPAFVAWMLVRRRFRAAALFLVCVALPIVPVTVRNRLASGETVLVSANGGINFWMGNNPDWRRTTTLRPGPEWRAMQELPLRELGPVPSSVRDRWFLHNGLRSWLRQPIDSLGRTLEKMLLLVHSHELMRDFDYYVFRDRFSWVLRVPSWNFACLLGLAVIGFVWARSRAAGEGALWIYLVSYSAGIVLFFVTARYRAPLLPVLAVFAAQGAVWLVNRVRSRRWVDVGSAVLVGGAVLALSTVDFMDVDRIDVAEADYRIATTYEKSGRFQDALLRYDAVLARDPDHRLAAARAGVAAQMLGRTQEAVDRYEKLLERHPDYAEAALNLANLAAQQGNREAADHYFALTFEADPFLAQAFASHALYLLQNGDAEGAVRDFEQALVIDPTWEGMRVEYARALLAAGNLDAASREIERAAAILPAADRLELVRGDILAARGQLAAARAAWERGLRANPSNDELRKRLVGGAAARP